MEFKHVLYEVKDQVAYITLNNPAKRNPLNIETDAELEACLDLCDYDDNVRMLVIRGAGGNFCGGGDLNAMKARIDQGIRGTRPVCRALGQTIIRLRNVKKPTLAWIEGAIAGAGIALALACDFTLIDESSKATFAFVNIGFIPDSGSAYFLAKAVGTVRATDLLMSGRVFTGREGADWGMFTAAFPKEELEAGVQKYIKKYSNGPTVAYANVKTLLNRIQYSEYSLVSQSELELQGECELTHDFAEAVTAFLEKRKPDYQGR
ncbi:enoyl-CoA hydratase-related protein [Desulfitobacterium sp. Sab5]|uniref:enoyl-CoA hydratase-related protein n=1 Tax=Desulfitobacterium nosdiversum TaxID=3375356 RepID=UPI003CF895A1